jgi:hypothetical protein
MVRALQKRRKARRLREHLAQSKEFLIAVGRSGIIASATHFPTLQEGLQPVIGTVAGRWCMIVASIRRMGLWLGAEVHSEHSRRVR